MFDDHGYDETTIADIAAAAGVTQMTFFRHFPAKELVVVDDPYDPAIAHAVAVQAADLPVVERVRRGLLAAWEQLGCRRRGVPVAAADRCRSSRAAGPDAGEQRADRSGYCGRVDGAGCAGVRGGGGRGCGDRSTDGGSVGMGERSRRGPMGDAVTAALALLEIRPPQ